MLREGGGRRGLDFPSGVENPSEEGKERKGKTVASAVEFVESEGWRWRSVWRGRRKEGKKKGEGRGEADLGRRDEDYRGWREGMAGALDGVVRRAG